MSGIDFTEFISSIATYELFKINTLFEYNVVASK